MARIVRLQAALVRDDALLLIQHTEHASGRSYWLLPGGGAEADETDEQCLRREMQEETGLDVVIERLLLDEPSPAGDVYQRHRTYLCRIRAGEARPGHEPEPEVAAVYAITGTQWIDLRDTAAWNTTITTDTLAYPMLQRVRAALGYS